MAKFPFYRGFQRKDGKKNISSRFSDFSIIPGFDTQKGIIIYLSTETMNY